MFGWMRNLMTGWSRTRQINRLRADLTEAHREVLETKARYEAAVHNDETLGLWGKADNLSARTANSLEVRTELRKRSRHEAANGEHMRGITLTLANDLIGTGPSLQILLEDETACDQIENAWNAWAEEICLTQKLHTFTLAKIVDGEGVAKLVKNDSLMSSVRLDVQVIECDLLSTPYQRLKVGDMAVDGIRFDEHGYPAAYHFLKHHPGDGGFGGDDFKEEAARNVLHWFRIDRPQQARGIPEMTPALLTFAHLREYDAAVQTAARVAACLTAIIHTKATPENGFLSSEFSATDLEPGMMLGAPDGYDVTQMKAEQPATTYDAYTLRKLASACHAVCIPYAIATGDFSKESYAGGRMARQVYQNSVNVQRTHLNQLVLNKIFAAWLAEAIRVPKLLPKGTPGLASAIPHAWYYDAWQHIDETKAASATTINLSNCTTTLAIECQKLKLDWRKVIKQRAKEIEMLQKAGALILPPGTPPLDGSPQNGTKNTKDAKSVDAGIAAIAQGISAINHGTAMINAAFEATDTDEAREKRMAV